MNKLFYLLIYVLQQIRNYVTLYIIIILTMNRTLKISVFQSF